MIQKFIIFVKGKKKFTFEGKMWSLFTFHFSLDGYTIWQFYKYDISERWAYVLNYI